ALEGTIAVLREQLGKAEARADQALGDLREERVAAQEERRRLADRIAWLEAKIEAKARPWWRRRPVFWARARV
ncbi:MAG: hypothetical protein JO110_17090, partial [Acetobacteraceae bacterium]|nr:hypothetical protein [Acetobacteraceae bacterium]